MPLGKEVGLGPGHIVLDGDPAPKQPLPIFGPCLLWPNGRPSQQLLSSCLIGHTKDSPANITEGNYGLTERPQALTVDHFWRGKQHKQLLLHMPSAINYRQASVHWTPTTYRLKLCIIWLGSWGLSWLSERQLRLLACT